MSGNIFERMLNVDSESTNVSLWNLTDPINIADECDYKSKRFLEIYTQDSPQNKFKTSKLATDLSDLFAQFIRSPVFC